MLLSENGLSLTDEFVFVGENQRVTETLISILPVKIENNEAIIGGKYKISVLGGTLRCEKIPFNDDNMVKIWGSDGVHRITLECQNETEVTVKIEKI
jgi:hypothetical protein